MSINKANKEKRNNRIYKAYLKMVSVKEHGKQKYTYDFIEASIADDFCLEPSTIGKIILERKRNERQ